MWLIQITGSGDSKATGKLVILVLPGLEQFYPDRGVPRLASDMGVALFLLLNCAAMLDIFYIRLRWLHRVPPPPPPGVTFFLY